MGIALTSGSVSLPSCSSSRLRLLKDCCCCCCCCCLRCLWSCLTSFLPSDPPPSRSSAPLRGGSSFTPSTSLALPRPFRSRSSWPRVSLSFDLRTPRVSRAYNSPTCCCSRSGLRRASFSLRVACCCLRDLAISLALSTFLCAATGFTSLDIVSTFGFQASPSPRHESESTWGFRGAMTCS